MMFAPSLKRLPLLAALALALLITTFSLAADSLPKCVFLAGDSVMAALDPENTDAARRIIGAAGWKVAINGRECRKTATPGCRYGQRPRPESVIEVLRANRNSACAVVITVGHNDEPGPSFRRSVLAVMEETAHVPQTFWVTLREVKPAYAAANQTIAEAAAGYPNVQLLPWAERSRAQSTWVAADNLHLTSDGAAQFATMVLEALETWHAQAMDGAHSSN